MVLEHREQLERNGHLERRRTRQALQWMNELISLGLEEAFHRDRTVAARLHELQTAVESGRVTPLAASRELLELYQLQQKVDI